MPSLLGRCKQKQRGLRGLLCRWPSITEWEMFITAQGCRLRNDLYCVEWDVKLYYTYHTSDAFVFKLDALLNGDNTCYGPFFQDHPGFFLLG